MSVQSKQILNKILAADPSVTSDKSHGFSVGETALNSISNDFFVCKDNTDNNAVWQKINGGAGNAFDNYQFNDSSGNITLKDFPQVEYTIGSEDSFTEGKCQYSSLTDAINDLPPWGKVNYAAIAVPGSGYVGSEIITVNGGNSLCYVRVISVGGSGEVTEIELMPLLSEQYLNGISTTIPLGVGSGLQLYIGTIFPLLKCHPDYNDIAGNVTPPLLTELKANYLFSSVENSVLSFHKVNVEIAEIDARNVVIQGEGGFDFACKNITKHSPLSSGSDTAAVFGSSVTAYQSPVKIDVLSVTDSFNGVDCIAGEIEYYGKVISIVDGLAIGHPSRIYLNNSVINVYNTKIIQYGGASHIFLVDSGNPHCERNFYGCNLTRHSTSANSYAFNLRGGTIKVYGGSITGVESLCFGTSGTLELIGCSIDPNMKIEQPPGCILKIIGNPNISNGAISNNAVISFPNITTSSAGLMWIWVKKFVGAGGAEHHYVAYIRYDGSVNPLYEPYVKLLTDTDTGFSTTKDNAGTLNIYFENNCLQVQSKAGFVDSIADSRIIFSGFKY